jgi:hypothetical protein
MKRQPLNMVPNQLDWPPERVPPLIELVFFFFRICRKSWHRRIRVFDENPVKILDNFIDLSAVDQPGDPEG